MDSSKFDALTRALVTSRSRRSLARGAAAAGVAAIGIRFGRASAAPEDKVAICHFTGSSSNPYEIISVSGNAFSSHQVEHGDFIYTDCCLESECTAYANSFCDSGTCSCAPTTCADLGVECGEWDDGCGGTATGCAACTAFPNSFCGDDGQCACSADTCADLGVECGDHGDGCGGTATGCAECVEFPNSFCSDAGQCECAALTQEQACGNDIFGTVSDGCGGTYYCGCSAAVISSSLTDATAPVNRDDDVRVQVNGVTRYVEANTFSGPAELIPIGPVRNGDEINVVAWDPAYGNLWQIDPLYLHCPADGRSQTLDSAGFYQDVDDFQTAPLPNGFYNEDFTVAL